ncbi:Hsp20/alpha crystallin family protein [Wolbachia endosymbiont (group E) of Neria commutata]|uniref:Hsp20/alpha crystallin family protein n=1 Tax=Wolbachia endosymbiont (group E) of Neria commutata TaxID=3066149 RepID=UPI003132C293
MSNIVRSNKNFGSDDFSIRGLQRAVDDMFNSFFTPELTKSRNTLPACDFYETDKNYCLSMDLPGFSKESIDISMSGNNLIIKGEKKYENESSEEEKKYYHLERYYGSFYRSIELTPNAEQDKISADFSNGVLKINIPKSEKYTKKIEIK